MNIAVIFAGGVGSRMHSKERPKQFLEMYNKPIIIHTLEHFEKHKDIDAIVVVCINGWIQYLKDLLYKFRIEKVKSVVPGGTTGQLSIYNGLKAAKEIAGNEKSIVLIHDGVRPLINEKVISDNIQSVLNYGSAITTAKVKETILVVNEDHGGDLGDRGVSVSVPNGLAGRIRDIEQLVQKQHRLAVGGQVECQQTLIGFHGDTGQIPHAFGVADDHLGQALCAQCGTNPVNTFHFHKFDSPFVCFPTYNR